MHAKVRMFLMERDKAYARNDIGVIRSMNAELRRLNIPDDATLEHPSGKPGKAARERQTAPQTPKEHKQGGRPKLPRCEHENIADRCEECNPELAAR